ncbi:hypothetical protein DZJ_41550 [Dickeya ananatis]
MGTVEKVVGTDALGNVVPTLVIEHQPPLAPTVPLRWNGAEVLALLPDGRGILPV